MTQLLQNAVYGTALILAAALLRRVLGDKLVPEARLALWAACLFRLLTPAAPSSVLSLWGLFGREAQNAPAPLPAGTVPNGAGAAAPGVSGAVVPAPAPTEAGIPWEMLLLGIWLAVGGLLAARYALSYVRTRRAVGCAVPVGRDDPRYLALPRCARLREGPVDGAPLTFGAVRPTVVLTPGLSGAVLECVLAHEAVHARRRDNLWHYVTAAALAVYWWNPAVWLMARLLRRDVELSCDRAALKRLGDARRADYAGALVSMATTAEGPAFCQTFGRKAAEERVISIMKYKKTTIAGAALTLALVLAVTVGFASNPAQPDEDSTTSSAPSDLMYSLSIDEDDGLTKLVIGLDYLEKRLEERVADGSMTQAEADRVLAQAREFSPDGKELVWSFQGDSGLYVRSDLVKAERDFPVFYKDENGDLVPVDPATVVSGFIFPAGSGAVEFMGRTYNRADLSQETLDWLDWYLALDEQEQLAISYVPAELRPQGDDVGTYDANDPNGEIPAGEQGFTHDPNGPEDPAGAGDEPICNLPLAPDGSGDEPIACPPEIIDQNVQLPEGADGRTFNAFTVADVSGGCPVEGCNMTTTHYHDGMWRCAFDVCPFEDCSVPGGHEHDGVVYSCNGHAHQDGVCDGSCYTTTGLPEPVRTDCYPDDSGHHSGGHHHGGHH